MNKRYYDIDGKPISSLEWQNLSKIDHTLRESKICFKRVKIVTKWVGYDDNNNKPPRIFQTTFYIRDVAVKRYSFPDMKLALDSHNVFNIGYDGPVSYWKLWREYRRKRPTKPMSKWWIALPQALVLVMEFVLMATGVYSWSDPWPWGFIGLNFGLLIMHISHILGPDTGPKDDLINLLEAENKWLKSQLQKAGKI